MLERVKVSYDAFVVGAAHMKVDLFLYNIDSTILGAHTVSVCLGERGGSDQTNEEEEKKMVLSFSNFFAPESAAAAQILNCEPKSKALTCWYLFERKTTGCLLVT